MAHFPTRFPPLASRFPPLLLAMLAATAPAPVWAANTAAPAGSATTSTTTVQLGAPKAGAMKPAGTPETDALVKAADELRKKGDYPGALKKVTEALKKLPTHPQGLLLAGTLEGSMGKLDEALDHLKRAVAQMPDNLFARKVYASALLQKGNTALALETLEPALKAVPVDPQAQTIGAQISAMGADLEGAHRYLDKALKADPNYAPAHQLSARVAFAQKRPDEARTQLLALVKLQPDDTDALLALASLDASSGKLQDAAGWLEKARKAKPSAPEPLIASAGLALREGHADEAASYLPKLEALLPGKPIVLALKGQLALLQGHPKDALAPLEAAFKQQPGPEIFVQLHQALLGSGQTADADKRMNAWLEAHGDDLRMRFYDAETLARRQEFAPAAAQYRKILEKDPNNAVALNDLAQSLQALKDPKAVEVAEQAYKLKPDSPAAENTLGAILMTTGKQERGLGLLKDAAAHAPQNPEVRFDYARGLASTGDKVRARSELEALLALKRPFQNEAAARDMLKSLSGS